MKVPTMTPTLVSKKQAVSKHGCFPLSTCAYPCHKWEYTMVTGASMKRWTRITMTTSHECICISLQRTASPLSTLSTTPWHRDACTCMLTFSAALLSGYIHASRLAASYVTMHQLSKSKHKHQSSGGSQPPNPAPLIGPAAHKHWPANYSMGVSAVGRSHIVFCVFLCQ